MGKHRIAILAGDGIGPEVTTEAVRVLNAVGAKCGIQYDWNELPWSSAAYLQTGHMVPPGGWEMLAQHDAILFGAIGSPDVPDTIPVHQLLLPMRRKFDLYVNLRPAYLFAGAPCPLKNKQPGSIDMLVYRENTEGEYAPIGGRLYEGTPHEVATQTAVFTRHGCERIIRAAFDGARKRRKHLTCITKSNALAYSMVFWDSVCRDVQKDYPDVTVAMLLVDAAAMDMVRKPEIFDVVVCSNLFGDILTDLSTAITGSIGLGASANLNPTRKFPSMFEPIHGSAPDIAGKGISNPLAAILSAGLMLDHLGEADGAKLIRDAVAKTLSDAKVMPNDLGGKATTVEVGAAVVANL